jgi:endonuclease/exonuclease/phosphatase family metal-dependent hydrolase
MMGESRHVLPVGWMLAIAGFCILATGQGSGTAGQPSPYSSSSPAGQAPTLSIMTFNIRYGTAEDGENSWSYRRGFLFDVVREAAPDVLGAQEALRFQLDELLTELPGYAQVGVGRDDGGAAGEFSAILYRTERLEVLEHGTFWFSETPDIPSIAVTWGASLPRICSWARFVDKASGKRFYVFNVHFSSGSQRARERSAELLVARISERRHPDPVIVTGDFNAGENNPAMLYILGSSASHSLNVRDSYRDLHSGSDGIGTFNDFSGNRDGNKIDAVLISAEWEVAEASIIHTSRDGRYPSDHFPVTAVLRFHE